MSLKITGPEGLELEFDAEAAVWAAGVGESGRIASMLNRAGMPPLYSHDLPQTWVGRALALYGLGEGLVFSGDTAWPDGRDAGADAEGD